MTITINLEPDQESQLRQRALDSGEDIAGYVERLIEKELAGGARLRDLYAPVREQIRESGILEAELSALLEEAREEAYQAGLSRLPND